MALIGGLLIVGIRLVIIVSWQNPGISSSQGVFDRLFVLPLAEAFVVTYFAFFFAAPIWLLFYLPCHLFIPRKSVLWQPGCALL